MTKTTDTRNRYGTTLVANYVGERTDKGDGPGQDWDHLLWDVTLTREGSDPITFPFRMGMAHQQTKCGKPMPLVTRYRATPESVCGHVTCAAKGWQPTPPSLYDVLCSLKADATDGRTFAEWAGDFGMDTDSIKARDLYFACQESENRSRRFFGADWERIVEDEDYV